MVMSISIKKIALPVLLALAALFTAFGVIYSKDLHRRLFIHQQMLLKQADNSKVEWSKLLLEQSALAAEPRIQQIATKKLGMLVPNARSIVLVSSS